MNAPNLRDEIFKGCTRPAMLFGVPIVPFVVTVGAILIAGMWTFIVSSAAAMIVLSLMIPALFAMRMVTRSDDQRLRQRFMALRMRLSQRNGKFWGRVRTRRPGRRSVRAANRLRSSKPKPRAK